MQSRLIVKNFGPIKSVDLDLRNVNVFIGPQASGKSALAKIYTIFKAPRKFLKNKEKSLPEDVQQFETSFKEILEEYNIVSFLKPDTEIEFESELHSISYKQGKITYNPKLLIKISDLEKLKAHFKENAEKIKAEIIQLSKKFFLFRLTVRALLQEEGKISFPIEKTTKFKELTEEYFSEIIDIIKEAEINLSTNTALYIPAERNFINIIKNASLNLLHNNVPIPKHILSFGAELEKSAIKEIDLNFLQKNLIYKSINGEDRVFTTIDHSIKLTEAASGIQSVLPILIPILSRDVFSEHRSFVIEEPELNLFPMAQYELIKQLESKRREALWEDYGNIHTYTTHSPYILSTLNNLLYAHKVKLSIMGEMAFAKHQGEEEDVYNKASRLVGNIISASISPDFFTAYQINDGNAELILDRDTGLIKENYIDDASDKLADDFEALTDLLNEYKAPSK